ncbi:crocetin glucosyltransferase, chloroplastic-like [Diospyros lotus]|uniref:crocetin glucosyltransferase, chloroplastic-like n=1 Tax=Diospyros lotus TaxID=55363 RepID=UPI00224DA2E7|nr:crocetin glucosyltransferase, chloroplastic-like [Diospyros lotus]
MDHGGHVLVVAFPGQGHINPALQFAKRLLGMGLKVTFVTAFSALNRMTETAAAAPPGLSFVGFSDGYDNGWKTSDTEHFMVEQKRRGSAAMEELVASAAAQGQPFVHVVYCILLPWVGRVAQKLGLPATFLWLQPASLLDIYFYYFNGYGDEIMKNSDDPSWSIQLPGLPPLTADDLPPFLFPSDPSNFAIALFKEHIDVITDSQQTNPNSKVLVNTFDELEFDALRSVKKLNMIAAGPLIPTAFLDGKDPSDTSFGCDLFQKTKDYTDWLNSKPTASVIYVSFGSYLVLKDHEMEAIARGLLETRRPFLWVVRSGGTDDDQGYELSCKAELEEQGLVIPWCSQVEVLSNPSVGCFFTHCGWNSCIESLALGVPVVGFPLWTDQATNAKLVQDVWKAGIKVRRNREGMVEDGEVKRCLEMAMEGEEMRRNARKWKDLAKEAAMEGGSSYLNIKNFVDELRGI